jgi:hypothetical protein
MFLAKLIIAFLQHLNFFLYSVPNTQYFRRKKFIKGIDPVTIRTAKNGDSKR